MCIYNKVSVQLILEINIDGQNRENLSFQLVILLENSFHL